MVTHEVAANSVKKIKIPNALPPVLRAGWLS